MVNGHIGPACSTSGTLCKRLPSPPGLSDVTAPPWDTFWTKTVSQLRERLHLWNIALLFLWLPGHPSGTHRIK
jgi:hypothetical protein